VFDVQTEGLDELISNLAETARGFRRLVVVRLKELGDFVSYLCRVELEDVRYTGALEGSFVVEAHQATMKVSVYPTAKHRMFVRGGTPPHWAPIGPLKDWARVKLGDENLAYPVQRSIATHGTSVWQERKRGTKANPWPKRVVARGDFQAMVTRTAAAIGGDIVTRIVD
jgi:hypothetical protein